MHDLCYYFDKVVGDNDKMHELEEIICEVLHNFGVAHPDLHKEAMCKMHTVVFGEHFDERLADSAVNSLGVHWNKDTTNTMAKRLGVTELCDFYVLANYYYAKYSSILGSNDNIYAKMAKADIESNNSAVLKEYLLK